MKRDILFIDEELCDGCGLCVSDCAEGAIQIVDGKAKLVKEEFCDGFGDCIGTCPTGALRIEKREAVAFNVRATEQHLHQNFGQEGVKRFHEAHKRHLANQAGGGVTTKPAVSATETAHFGGGCPGSRMRDFSSATASASPAVDTIALPAQINPSELKQWPVQIHLVPPGAPFFKNKELVIMNTCGPLASADVHWRYLRGRGVVVGCPKLDNTEHYSAKIGMILEEPSIPKVIVVRMEVPCCGGLTMITQDAVERSGRTDLVLQEDVLNLDGSVKRSRVLSSN